MILYEHIGIKVRTLTESDAVLLVQWLNDPAVLLYYEGRDRPHDEELVRRHFYEKRERITQCIVEKEGRPIGYIQYYPISEEERLEYGYAEAKERIYGMDQFIGETDCWNKGIGTELVSSMADFVITHEHADRIVMDPQTWNTRALRVYEKCGFVRVKILPQHEWHEGENKDCWLIEYKRG
ncbi:GNAT family N-acetyltransferase [Paenibacillus sp. GP183]|jgi:aminoglycoside 6'-N-acetyltransferase|uniref:GNAT family N-acetyltransferase n=1 Tax=Paenibacillus sp. GP183 TaxID=1882751 RepID=UPI0008961D2F|nr:GNAT family N-acetyltransferase [Paenibacillus sp. GP183]SEB49133.1 aminoglycoside 6'-N-acetyltransferase [Paenibacillus sp. GP183]